MSAIFQLYPSEKKLHVCFVLDQHAYCSWISIVLAPQQSAGRYVIPLKHIILIPEPINLCSCSLILHAQQRSSKYQYHNPWFDLTWAQIHDLPNSSQLQFSSKFDPFLKLIHQYYMYVHKEMFSVKYRNSMDSHQKHYSTKNCEIYLYTGNI